MMDSHSHLEDAAYELDRLEVMERARASGVSRIINMGSTMSSSVKVVELAERNEWMYAGVGIHPEEQDEWSEVVMEELRELGCKAKVVCIGEIGLDYYWERDEQRRVRQEEIFMKQVELAEELGLPICVHMRKSEKRMGEMLRGMKVAGVVHSYSGSEELAYELIGRGWKVGIGGLVTRSRKLGRLVRKLPREGLVLETDAPYQLPAGYKGRNEPMNVLEVCRAVAELRGESPEEVSEYTDRNVREIYPKMR